MYQALKLVVSSFVLPPGGPIVLMLLGVLAMSRSPHRGRQLCVAGAGLLWLASLPLVAAALVTTLGGSRPVEMRVARSADAIVILGGGVRAQAVEYGGDTLGRLTLERTRYGAHLARLTALPILVTGGSPEKGVRAEADLMREALLTEYGLTVRWTDSRARNTRENASNAARLLLAEKKRRAILVVHGFDVYRTKRLFEAAGLQVIPAPTQVPHWESLDVSDFLPSAAALQTSHFAMYEWLALARDFFVAAR